MDDLTKKALAYLAEAIGPCAVLGLETIMAGGEPPPPPHIMDEAAAEAKRRGYKLLRN